MNCAETGTWLFGGEPLGAILCVGCSEKYGGLLIQRPHRPKSYSEYGIASYRLCYSIKGTTISLAKRDHFAKGRVPAFLRPRQAPCHQTAGYILAFM